MNTKALYAILLALLLPLVAYFVVKSESDKAVQMPPHYLPDSVVTRTVNGKKVTDTVWHKVADFSFKNQEGKVINWDSLHGKIVIADFFFTHCPTICPPLTKNMKRLEESINNGERVGDRTNQQVHFLSISIDPVRDTVERLKYWADRFQINPEKWWLLTGSTESVNKMVTDEMRIPYIDGKGDDTAFVHTDHFILIDSNHYIRGYYHGLDSASLSLLSKDIVLLTLEKDPHEKSFLSGKLQLIAVVFLVAILAVGLLLFFIRKKN